MQQFTYQDTTFHTTPYFSSRHTFCVSITPIHIQSLHISAHHSTSRPPHTTPGTSPHSNINCSAHVPNHNAHCISTIIPHQATMSMASHHSTTLGIPQPHFTSCVTAHHHIPHVPHHHSTSHHNMSGIA